MGQSTLLLGGGPLLDDFDDVIDATYTGVQ